MFEEFLSFPSFILILDSRRSLVFGIDEVIFVFRFIWKACIKKPIWKFYILRSIQEAFIYFKFRVETSSEHDDRAQWNQQYNKTCKSLVIMVENQPFSLILHVGIYCSITNTIESVYPRITPSLLHTIQLQPFSNTNQFHFLSIGIAWKPNNVWWRWILIWNVPHWIILTVSS